MAQCGYIYASGLRIASGEGTVELDGKVLRVVRNGKGKSRLDRYMGNPPSDGEITLKDLQAELAKRGETTTKLSVLADGRPFSATIDPAAAMGRAGRQGDFNAAFASMTPEERANAARYQLIESLPYSDKSARAETTARLAAVLEIVDVAELTETLPDSFKLFASPEQMQRALSAARPEDLLRFGPDEVFNKLLITNPIDALQYGWSRMSDDQFQAAISGAPYFALAYAVSRMSDEQFQAAITASPVSALEHKAARERLSDEQFSELAKLNPSAAAHFGSHRLSDAEKWNIAHASAANAALSLVGVSAADRRKLASSATTSAEVLALLADDQDLRVRYLAERNPSTPEQALHSASPEGEAGVGSHSTLPGLRRTAPGADAAIAAARMARIVSDKDPDVRRRAAHSPATSLVGLEILAHDPDERVRAAVASNKAASPETLRMLADDGSDYVRKTVAANPVTPPDVLEELSEDTSFYGVKDYLTHDGYRGQTREGNRASRTTAIANPNTPVETLVALSTDSKPATRAMVALNPSTPPEILTRLSQESEIRVRGRVAENTSAPQEVLERLASDPNPHVRIRVAKNAAASAETLRELAGELDEERDYTLIRAIAGNPSAPEDLIRRIAETTKYMQIRIPLYRNPATPDDVRNSFDPWIKKLGAHEDSGFLDSLG